MEEFGIKDSQRHSIKASESSMILDVSAIEFESPENPDLDIFVEKNKAQK